MKKAISIIAVALLAIAPSAEAAAKATFYLDLKIGCYSASKTPTKPQKWSTTNYKTLYSASCTSPHHYEVFAIVKLKAKDLSSDLAKKEAGDACTSAARKIIGSADIAETLTYGYFYPDPGAEEKKYGKKTICLFRITDSKDSNISLSVSTPAVKQNYV